MLKFLTHHRAVMIHHSIFTAFAACAESLDIEWHELTRNSTHMVVMMCDADAVKMRDHNERHQIMPSSSDGELPAPPASSTKLKRP